MENDFIRCSNGHYYRKSLNVCPYCGSALERGNTCLPNELKCSSKDYIVIKGHYYRLNSDGKTASFLCWSKVAWDIYRKYLSFHDWYIEATLDDVNEIAKEEAYYAKERIQSRFPSYEIPKEITLRGNVYPVVRIDNGAFAFCEISSILIPDTIVYIEKDAFFRCDGLEKLIIPDSVKELSYGAISECRNLIDITWQGITYANDSGEPFLFPDHKNKYAIKVDDSDHIDSQYAIEYTPEHISQLAPNEIFVFGSNLQGVHGGGAARYAYEHFGAEWGKGIGMAGHTYAIPTMHGGIKEIKPYVDEFVEFAEAHPQYKFLVTPIGCGIAGFTPSQIAPLFFKAIHIPNIILPREFYDVLLPLEENIMQQIIQ